MLRGRPTPIARNNRSPATITWIWTSEVLRRLGYAMYAVAALLIAASSVSGGTLSFAVEGGYHAYHGAKRAGEISQLAGVSLSRLLPWSLIILTATSTDRRSRRIVLLLAIPALAVMLGIGIAADRLAAIIIACGLTLRGARISWGGPSASRWRWRSSCH